MRHPLTLLVTSGLNDQAAGFLQELGAHVCYVPNERVIKTIRDSVTSKLEVDAIIIDGTSIIYVQGAIIGQAEKPLYVANMLVRDIRGLSSVIRMQNEISWNELPIIILVDEAYYEQMSWEYRNYSSSVTVCKVTFRPNGLAHPYDLPYGWDRIYNLITRKVQDWTYNFVEKMRSLGWSLVEGHGVKNVQYKSTKDDYDEKRLSPTRTRLNSDIKKHGLKREIYISRWDQTEIVLETLEKTIKIDLHIREYVFQRLFTDNPHLLGAASFELGVAARI